MAASASSTPQRDVYTIDQLRAIVRPIADRLGMRSVAVFGSYARGEALFAAFVAITSLFTAFRCLMPDAEAWLSDLMYTSYWFIELFAFAWLSSRSGILFAGKRLDMLGLGAVYLIGAVASTAGRLLPVQTACILALVLTLVAFIMLFIVRDSASATSAQDTIRKVDNSADTPPLISEDGASYMGRWVTKP